jgi:hypothetical protein
MNNYNKKIITCIISAAVIFCLNFKLHAIGKFSLGVNTGLTYDPNNLENDINLINKEIEYQKASTAGTQGKQVEVPYACLLGANIKYQFNFLLFRLGGYFAQTFTGCKGSFTSAAGQQNSIHLSNFQASFPLSFAFLLPVKEMTYFYLGGGFTLHRASVKITQSNPDAGPFPPGGNRRNSYSAYFPGWHLLVGAEVPLSGKYSVSVEWMHQEGISHPVKNNGLDNTGSPVDTPKRTINARGDFIFFGINYYISI